MFDILSKELEITPDQAARFQERRLTYAYFKFNSTNFIFLIAGIEHWIY